MITIKKMAVLLLIISSALLYGTEAYLGLIAQGEEKGLDLPQINNQKKIQILKSPIIKPPILSLIYMEHLSFENNKFQEWRLWVSFSKEDDAKRVAFFQKAYKEKRKLCIILDNTIILASTLSIASERDCNSRDFLITLHADKYKEIIKHIEKKKLTLPSYFKINCNENSVRQLK